MPETEGATKVDVWISQKGSDWIRVSWDPSGDGDKFSRYEVYIDKGNGFQLAGDPIYNLDTTNLKVTGLKPDTEYEFKVRDYDTDGLQEDSEVKKTKTEPKPLLAGFEWPVVAAGTALAVLFLGYTRNRNRRSKS